MEYALKRGPGGKRSIGGGGAVKYRWLDSERPVSHKRLGIGTILALPTPGCIGNVLVRFASGDVTVPAGALRNVKADVPQP